VKVKLNRLHKSALYKVGGQVHVSTGLLASISIGYEVGRIPGHMILGLCELYAVISACFYIVIVWMTIYLIQKWQEDK
jgi:hypothetical protein